MVEKAVGARVLFSWHFEGQLASKMVWIGGSWGFPIPLGSKKTEPRLEPKWFGAEARWFGGYEVVFSHLPHKTQCKPPVEGA